eukprot:NODE_4648_length_1865_cov_7.391830.p1 GENE.NODE_4648_length_1865_cov_7.391830~~NODE_4648_length_1865_cov_7.391830.p1  ORF type:complete len:555 (-),score=237.33 NODE_4648_length_1865_cov_7.391830:200-1702(-)
MVDASMLTAEDGQQLAALMQQNSEDTGAPDSATYEHHSSTSILDQLESLLEKARAQLEDGRRKETLAIHNFEMQKRALEEGIAFANKNLKQAKRERSAKTESKAAAESELAMASKQVAEDKKTLAVLQQDCAANDQEHTLEQASRAEELKALAAAAKALSEMTKDAQGHSYTLSQTTSFMQCSLSSTTGLAHMEVVRIISELAKQQHSEELAQLGRRISASFRNAASVGEDPFAKVKGLITDLISKLERVAQADASHKAYCDKERADTKVKREDTQAIVNRLSGEIDTRNARGATLKGQLADFQAGLAATAKARKEMQKARQEEHALYIKNKPEMEAGIKGVGIALKTLRDYYNQDGKAHSAKTGAASSIIGMLEVVMADFSKEFGEMTANEETSQDEFEREIHEMDIEVATKEQGVKYAEKEITDLAKDLAERKLDHQSETTELSAILEYKAKIEEMCMPKAETYAEKKARRDAEIAGLKEALSSLEGQAVFMQRTRAQ